jgi:putative aminopeptidase FrvX
LSYLNPAKLHGLSPQENKRNTVMRSSSTADLSGLLITLRHLIREPSVVGAEDSFFRVIRRELEELDISVERHSGLLVARGNNPDTAYLSAHVDRNGLVCTGPNEFQYAAFIASNRSELTGDSVSEQMVATIADRFTGQRIQAHLPYTGTYIGQGTISSGYLCPKRSNLIFEVEGLDYLEPGTPVAFLDRLKVTDRHISAQLDNVVSVALIIYLYRLGYQGTAFFTAQEEAGKSWRYILAWFQRESLCTKRLLVLDTSPYPTQEEAEEQDLTLRNQDATSMFDSNFTNEIVNRCDALGISYSFKDEWIQKRNLDREKPLSLGRTELGRLISASDGQINGTTLQIPTTGYHTANETASLSSLTAALGLLSSISRSSKS